MTSQEFLFWLQGFFEIADPKTLDERQIQVIKDHIALVLKKETPDRNEKPKTTLQGDLTLEQWQEILRGKRSPGSTPPIVEPFPQFPGVIPGISPEFPGIPPYTVTCCATGSPTAAGGSGEPAYAKPVDPLASPAFLAAFDPESVKLC